MVQPLELLQQVPLFTSIDDAALHKLASESRRINVPRNTTVIHEGDTGDKMYVIETGRVKVFVSDEQNHEMVLFIEGPGSVIGEFALLDDAPRSASVKTLDKTSLITITKQQFQQLLRENPEVALKIIASLTAKVRFATDWIKRLALKNVYRRFVERLYELADDEPDSDGGVIIMRRYSHRELGDLVGSSREMISRIVLELTKGGYLEFHADRICVTKRPPADW